jgi:hypothetical protein
VRRILRLIDGQRNIHLSNLDLHAKPRESLDVIRDRFSVRLQTEEMHLEANAVDGYAAPLKIFDLFVNSV